MMFKILQALTRIHLIFFARFIGEDEYRNKYFQSNKRKDYLSRYKRFCIFNGKVEASKIPAEWHSWMHYNAEAPISYKKQFWMKSHTPVLTGTVYAFTPNSNSSTNIYEKTNAKKNQNYTPWNGKISHE